MERWYWVELIGFDNESADFGVSEYISRTESVTGVSLLFAHIDFLFEQQNEQLPPTACSYYAHEYNRERRRQNWTKTQLRGLIKTLHSHGVKVFFSFFDTTGIINDPAYLSYGKSGKPRHSVYVIKPLENGTVGDVVIEKMREIIDEYGFDGIQISDGISSNRSSLENGDFSTSLCRRSGLKIPKSLMGEDEDSYARRREWILKNHRFEWIKFIADSWAEFYEKLYREIDKPIMFNIAWTRGPFEALYRYGLDYSRCGVDRAMAAMIEENSATRAITAQEDEGGVEFPLSRRDRFTYEYALMQREIKLATRGLSQLSLMPISDTMEQWDALRHCPTELTRSIVRRYNNFVWQNGRFVPCSDAPHYCLADAISAEDWRWIAKQESYRLPPVDFVDGFVGVYNHSALYADVERFCKKKHYFGAALKEELLCAGLNLGAEIALSDTENFDRARCLLVTDLDVYTEEEKQSLARASLPILAIGENVELPIGKCIKYSGKYLSVALYNAPTEVCFDELSSLEKAIRKVPTKHGEIWTEPLSHRRVAPEFFIKLSEILNGAFELGRSSPDVKLASYICEGEHYVLLSNDRHTYYLPTVKTGKEVKGATALMKDRGYTVKCRESTFTVRIPPRGIEIVKLEK